MAFACLLPCVTVLPLLAGQTPRAATDSNPCDRQLVKSTADPLAYRLRGERCEGLYFREVAGTGGLSVVAFTSATPSFAVRRDEPLVVEWAPPGDAPVSLRAVSLRRKLYYRMDTRRPPGANRFEWPTDVLTALNLRGDELGLVAWIENGKGMGDVYVPLRIGGAAAPAGLAAYAVQVVPGSELQEIFVTLVGVGGSGPDEPALLRDQPLARGFYPAERPVPVRLPKLPKSGLYRLQLNAILKSGAPTSRNLYFQHAGA